MRLQVKKFFWVMLLAALSLMPTGVGAQKKPPTPPPTEIKKEQPPEVPNLAELVLRSNELSSRRAALTTLPSGRASSQALASI